MIKLVLLIIICVAIALLKVRLMRYFDGAIDVIESEGGYDC